MMKLAVISDVHADVHALNDALAQIDQLGIGQVVCCGDLIDYGLFPEETLKLLRDRKIVCIRGNHDRWAVKDGVDMSGWSLTAASITFLESLPATWSTTIYGVRVVLWHAQPKSDMHGIDDGTTTSQEFKTTLDDAEADVLLVGHTHIPFVRQLGMMRLVANPGALLCNPADGIELPTPGTFGILTIEHERARFEVRRARDGRSPTLAIMKKANREERRTELLQKLEALHVRMLNAEAFLHAVRDVHERAEWVANGNQESRRDRNRMGCYIEQLVVTVDHLLAKSRDAVEFATRRAAKLSG